jgi:hypothetical protein
MIPWAIDDFIISDDALWKSALKDVHGLPQVSAQLAERFGRWPAFGGLTRPGRRLNLVTLWNHSTSALRAAAKRQFEQYASPEREVIRRLTAVDCVVPGVSPSSVLLALGPWNVTRSGSTYAPCNLLNPATIGTVSGGVIWRPGRFGQAIQVSEATTNLITNPSFEVDLAGWTTSGGTRVATGGRYGTAYLSAGTYTYVSATISNSTAYTLSFYHRGSYHLAIDHGDGITHDYIGTGTVDSAGWARFALTFTSQGTACVIYMYGYSYDGFQLEQKAYATPYADGSLGLGHTWSGTAHASTSSRTATSCKFTNPISTTAGTMVLWWNPSADNTGPTQYIFSEGNLKAYFNAAGDIIYFTDGTNTVQTSALTFSAETWMHLAFTWAAGALAIYRNGVSVASGATYTAPTAGSYLFLGSDTSSANQANGLLDQVLVLGAALTAAQVSTLYTAQLAADWKPRWCNVLAEEVKAFAIGGEETNQGVVSTLAVDGDVCWRSRDGAAFWRVIAATGSCVVNNDGDDDAYPLIYITPKTAKTGNVWSYKRWIPVKWLPTVAVTSYPVDICNAGFDTATLVTATKMLASGNDLRVKVDGVEVNRWLDGINGATTKVWCNINWQASQTATMAAIGSASSTTLTATTDITNWPSTGILYIDTEAITYTGKSAADKTFTGCTRGAKGTTAATHAAAATAYWIQHDVWILYGNASAAAPTVDDNYKPAFELDHSTNTSWVYEAFGEDDGLRSASWAFSGDGSKYTGTRGANSNPWETIGLAGPASTGLWALYNPCGITNVNFTSGEKYVTNGTSWFSTVGVAPLTGILSSASGNWGWGIRTDEYGIAAPSNTTWTAWNRDEAITAGAKYVALALGNYAPAAPSYLDAAGATVTLNSSYTPVIAIGAEQSNYDLSVTLTNSTTGDSIVIALTMQLNQTLEINSDAKTITLLADNSQQMQALTLTGGARRDWLRLAAGNNTLTWNDTGTVSVEVEILFDRRYFE